MRFAVVPILAALSGWALAPLYLLLKVSFSPPAEVMTAHPTFLPHGLTWDHWRALLATDQVLAPLAKSLTTATLVAMAAVLLAAPAATAWPVSRRAGGMASCSACSHSGCCRR